MLQQIFVCFVFTMKFLFNACHLNSVEKTPPQIKETLISLSIKYLTLGLPSGVFVSLFP